QDVRDAPCLQRTNVGSGHVRAKVAEPAEENGNMTWPDRGRAALLFDGPAAPIDYPVDDCTHTVWERRVDSRVDDLAEVAIRPRNRQCDKSRPPDDLGPGRLQGDIGRLAAIGGRRHRRSESAIDEGLDRGRRPKAGGEVEQCGSGTKQALLYVF